MKFIIGLLIACSVFCAKTSFATGCIERYKNVYSRIEPGLFTEAKPGNSNSYFKITACGCSGSVTVNGVQYNVSVGYTTSDANGCSATDVCGVQSVYVIIGIAGSVPYQSTEGTGSVGAVMNICSVNQCLMSKNQ